LFGLLDRVCATDPGDVARFAAIGVWPGRISVAGSIKFDEEGNAGPPPRLGEVAALCESLKCLRGRRLVLAASTHPGEEALVARAWAGLREAFPDTALVVVPRHFERAAAAAADLAALGLRPMLRSQAGNPDAAATAGCLIVDATGELRAWIERAEIVVVGKSFAPHSGGQNPAEAVRAGKATLTGPRMDNFGPLMDALLAAGGLRRLAGEDELAPALAGLLADPAGGAAMAARGRAALTLHDGATRRSIAAILGA
jgi:3-deoxy-D-manno-octulosonic-acid transferase